MAKATHVWEVIGDVLVSVTTAGLIPDEQWKGWLKELQTKPLRKCIGATFGATELTSIQRKEGSEAARQRGIKVAVVTDESLVRGIVTAVSWLGAPIRSFSWADMQGAIKYLEILPPLDQRVIHWYQGARHREIG